MKVTVKHIDSDVPKENYEFFNDFIQYLQKSYPLKHDVTIKFVGERVGDMTTGQRNTKDELLILQKLKNCNFDIIKGWEFYPTKMFYPFRKYIDNLYKLKSIEKDPVHKYMYKTILNSSYGVMAETSGGKMGMLFNSIYASLITARCRCKIFNASTKDTASIATDCIISKKPLNLQISNNLGDWKLEANGENGIIIMNGVYNIADKIGQRGFPELFESLKENVKHTVIEKIYNTPWSMGEALLRKDPERINIFRKITKKCDINGEPKRIWLKNFKDIDEMLHTNMESIPYTVGMEDIFTEIPYPNINLKDLQFINRNYITQHTQSI